MAEFDRAVPPGGKGKITLRVQTKGYQGNISKTAQVYTNDPDKKQIILSMKAYVDVPTSYLLARSF